MLFRSAAVNVPSSPSADEKPALRVTSPVTYFTPIADTVLSWIFSSPSAMILSPAA